MNCDYMSSFLPPEEVGLVLESRVLTRVTDVNPDTGKITWDVDYEDSLEDLHDKLVAADELAARLALDHDLEQISKQIRALRIKVARMANR
jgi:hypothetical protein